MPLTWGIKDIRFQEVQRVPHKKNPKKPAPRHITKMPKVKGKARLSKAARQIQLVINKGPSPRPWADFSTETPGQDGRAQNGQSAQTTRLPAENARQTVLPNWREFPQITTRLAFQKNIKEMALS